MNEPTPSTKYRLGEVYCLAAGSSPLCTFGSYLSSFSSFHATTEWAMLCRLADSVSPVCSDHHSFIVCQELLQVCRSRSLAAQSDRGIKSLPSLIYLGIHTRYIASAMPQLVLREATKCFKPCMCLADGTGGVELARAFHTGRVWTELLDFRMCGSRQR